MRTLAHPISGQAKRAAAVMAGSVALPPHGCSGGVVPAVPRSAVFCGPGPIPAGCPLLPFVCWICCRLAALAGALRDKLPDAPLPSGVVRRCNWSCAGWAVESCALGPRIPPPGAVQRGGGDCVAAAHTSATRRSHNNSAPEMGCVRKKGMRCVLCRCGRAVGVSFRCLAMFPGVARGTGCMPGGHPQTLCPGPACQTPCFPLLPWLLLSPASRAPRADREARKPSGVWALARREGSIPLPRHLAPPKETVLPEKPFLCTR